MRHSVAGVDRWCREPRGRWWRVRGGGEEVRSAMEWAQVRALAADGVSQREIARAAGDQSADGRAAGGGGGAAAVSAGAGGVDARSAGAGDAAAARGVAGDQGAAGDGDPARRLRLCGLGRSGPQAAGAAAAARGAAGAADGLSAGAGDAGRLGGDADAAADRRARAARLCADLLAAVLGRADGALQLRS